MELDGWLTGTLKFALGDVVMLERTSEALEHYRSVGQEWRVKPLAWTEREMSVALRASRKRISTDLTYYHSSRGVHFLSYPDFHAFAELARTDFPGFRAQLRELTSVFEGHATSSSRACSRGTPRPSSASRSCTDTMKSSYSGFDAAWRSRVSCRSSRS